LSPHRHQQTHQTVLGEREYDLLAKFLNALLDAGAADETHPLADLAASVGELMGDCDDKHHDHSMLSGESETYESRNPHKVNRCTVAIYDATNHRVVIRLASGVSIGFCADDSAGLSGASKEELSNIEITPSGLGLHWPRLDADVYVPSLLKGLL
jgi:hypothetical protein